MWRGEIWWADLPQPSGSGPGKRRPVLIIQADAFNQSRIQTRTVAVVTSNLRLADAPGNVRISSKQSQLSRDSVVNVSQIITIDKVFLTKKVSKLSASKMKQVEDGLKLLLDIA